MKEIKEQIMIGIICILITIGTYFCYLNPEAIFKRAHYTFGACFMTMNNPYYQVINDEIKKEVEYQGDQLITYDPLLDVKKQNDEINNLIEQNVDAIFITPIEADKIEATLQKAKQRNIPVIVVDAPVNDPSLVSCTVVSDNYGAGVKCAKAMMQEKKSARILLLEHPGAISAKERIQGFKDTIAGHDEYTIVESRDCLGQIENAYPMTKEMLQRHSSVDVIFALNDPSAMGALAALEDDGRKNVSVYGVDGTPECKQLIDGGKMTGTCAQYPIQTGNTAITIAYKILNKEEYEKNIMMDVTLINKHNISSFNVEGWQ